jgi:hypothetical protein
MTFPGTAARLWKKKVGSQWFMVMVLWNLPPWLRTKAEFLIPWGILPQGVSSSDFPLYYQPLQGDIHGSPLVFDEKCEIDFCNQLAGDGIVVYNGYKKVCQRTRGFNVFTVADYPACCECSNSSSNGKLG